MSKSVPISTRAPKSTRADDWVRDKPDARSVPAGRRKRLTIDMDVEAHRRLKMYCARNDRQIAEFVRELIENGVKDFAE